MKKKVRPLVVSRETLHALDTPELGKLRGGSDPNFCGTQGDSCWCISFRICPPDITTN